MAAYGTMDQALAGLMYGLTNEDQITGIAKASISFGSAVFAYKGDESAVYGYIQDSAKLVFSADLVASNSIQVTVPGYTIGAVTFATSHANTMNLIVNALASAGLEAVVDSSDATSRTLILRKKATTISSASAAVTGGASQASVTASYGSSQIFVGFAAFTAKEVGLNLGYAAGEVVNVMRSGRLWVNSTGSLKAHGITYFDAATGKVASSGIALPGRYFTNSNSQNLIVVELEGEQLDLPLSKF